MVTIKTSLFFSDLVEVINDHIGTCLQYKYKVYKLYIADNKKNTLKSTCNYVRGVIKVIKFTSFVLIR